MNIPEIHGSAAIASAPANRAAAPSGIRGSVQPTPKFKSIFGSMMSEEAGSAPTSNSTNRSSSQDTNPVPLPTVPSQPIVLPSGLQIHLLTSASAPRETSDPSDAETDTGASQDSANPSLSIPVTAISYAKSSPTPAAPTAASTASTPSKSASAPASKPQPTVPQPSIPPFAAATPAMQPTVESHPRAAQAPTRSDDQSGSSAPTEVLVQPLAVKSENSAPLSNSVLAFSAKLTALPGTPTQIAANPAGSKAAATQPAAPALPVSSETPAVTASSAGEQADSNPGNGSPLFAKQFQKLVNKYQADDGAQQPGSAAPAANPTTSQDAAVSIQTRPAAPTVEPASSSTANPNIGPAATQPSDARPAVAALPDTNLAAKSEPVKDLSLKLGTTPGNQVEVKIQDRAGEVRVSVLSSSPALTTDLRQQVGDLVGKLDRAGYHAETFRPSASLASQQSSNQSDAGDSQNPGGRQQQQQEESRQQSTARQKRAGQPQWLQEMNSNFGTTAVEGTQNQ